MVGGGVVSGATSCNGFSGQLLLSKSIYTPGNGFDWTSEGGDAPDWDDVVDVNVSSVGYQETTYPGSSQEYERTQAEISGPPEWNGADKNLTIPFQFPEKIEDPFNLYVYVTVDMTLNDGTSVTKTYYTQMDSNYVTDYDPPKCGEINYNSSTKSFDGNVEMGSAQNVQVLLLEDGDVVGDTLYLTSGDSNFSFHVDKPKRGASYSIRIIDDCGNPIEGECSAPVPTQCVKQPKFGEPIGGVKVGISTHNRNYTDNWLETYNRTFIALESREYGLVLPRQTTQEINSIKNPIEGMLVFDTTKNCLKMYDGQWGCLEQSCDE
ncbi:hypothetical protein EDM00_04950 [Ornithobacterium rhinotracheale]|nr:hypothetical protein [Ornithobacterium rhinotracheale]